MDPKGAGAGQDEAAEGGGRGDPRSRHGCNPPNATEGGEIEAAETREQRSAGLGGVLSIPSAYWLVGG